MTDRTQAKLQEGLKHVQEAEKHLKTGFFKWRPDYDSAAMSFQNAALCFKLAKQFQKACETYERLADAHYRTGARFHAGKAYEESGNACKELENYSKALSYYDRASDMYMENGTPDTAVLCLDRAGKIVETVNPEWSISLYMKAADICQSEDDSRFRQAAELVDKAARLQVETKKLSEAVNTLGHECQLLSQCEGGGESIPRLTCSIVLVHLHIGDPVRAEQAIYSACDYADCFDGSDEQNALMRLVEAFNDEDQENVTAVINTPMFKYMDNVYSKLARSLRVPGSSSPSRKSHVTESQLQAGPRSGKTEQASSKITEHMSAVNDITNKMDSLTQSVPLATVATETSCVTAPTNQQEDEEDDLC